MSKIYLKTLSTAFEDPRLQLIIADAAQYVKDHYTNHIENSSEPKYFDAIICDSSDPVGPADVLFQPEFFLSLKNVLNPVGGVLCTQGECMYLHLDLIHRVISNMREQKLFASVKYSYTMIPTYPSGQIGFMVATRDESVDVSTPRRALGGMETRYYSPEIHHAAFVLPSK